MSDWLTDIVKGKTEDRSRHSYCVNVRCCLEFWMLSRGISELIPRIFSQRHKEISIVVLSNVLVSVQVISSCFIRADSNYNFGLESRVTTILTVKCQKTRKSGVHVSWWLSLLSSFMFQSKNLSGIANHSHTIFHQRWYISCIVSELHSHLCQVAAFTPGGKCILEGGQIDNMSRLYIHVYTPIRPQTGAGEEKGKVLWRSTDEMRRWAGGSVEEVYDLQGEQTTSPGCRRSITRVHTVWDSHPIVPHRVWSTRFSQHVTWTGGDGGQDTESEW